MKPRRATVTVSNPVGVRGESGNDLAMVHSKAIFHFEIHAEASARERDVGPQVLVGLRVVIEMVHAEEKRVPSGPRKAQRDRLEFYELRHATSLPRGNGTGAVASRFVVETVGFADRARIGSTAALQPRDGRPSIHGGRAVGTPMTDHVSTSPCRARARAFDDHGQRLRYARRSRHG